MNVKTKFYGLTGGIGSGKSTVAAMFFEKNIPILDLDKVGHQILQNDPSIQNKLIQLFGSHIKIHHGINRKALAKSAFSSSHATTALNAVMHPAIESYERQWREQQTSPFAIIEASVLIESGGTKRMQGIIVVLADSHLRKERVLKRGTHNQAQFKRIIQNQCTDQQRKQYADYTLDNISDLEHLEQQVQELHHQLLNEN